MTTYTTIGFYPDSGQKFSTYINTGNADEALLIAEDQNPCLIVCGVVEGIQACLDREPYVTGSEKQDNYSKQSFSCKFCHRPVDPTTAHLHDGGYVGECCWDERLRTTK